TSAGRGVPPGGGRAEPSPPGHARVRTHARPGECSEAGHSWSRRAEGPRGPGGLLREGASSRGGDGPDQELPTVCSEVEEEIAVRARRNAVLEVCMVYGRYTISTPTSPNCSSSRSPLGVPRQSSPLKKWVKPTSRQVSSFEGVVSMWTWSTHRRLPTISARSAVGMTGSMRLTSRSISSLTTRSEEHTSELQSRF